MKKFLGVLSAAAVTFGLATTVPAAGTTTGATQTAAPSASAPAAISAARPRFTMRNRWAREITRYGDSDTSTRHIEHVTELQYRLRWAGAYNGPVTGNFRTLTRKAVKRYQRRENLRVTGVAGHRTWAHLLRDTVRRRGVIPRICKSRGWHACYDRKRHQVTLWRGGRIRNTWLVRGGSSSTPTRRGNTHVYYRNKDHVSRAYGAPMPYAQFFDGGQAYHGSTYMMDPFVGHSHGCINMYIEDARQLWNLTHDKRLGVTVYGAWD